MAVVGVISIWQQPSRLKPCLPSSPMTDLSIPPRFSPPARSSRLRYLQPRQQKVGNNEKYVKNAMDDESFMKVRADWICKNVVDEMRQEMVAVLLDYCQITVMVVESSKGHRSVPCSTRSL